MTTLVSKVDNIVINSVNGNFVVIDSGVAWGNDSNVYGFW